MAAPVITEPAVAAPVTAEPDAVEPASHVAEGPALKGRCPAGMALIDGRFCIDRWEAVTLTKDGKLHSPYHAVATEGVAADSRPGVVPQAYISMEEADAACKQSGKRLCTTQQWVDACMGSAKPKRSYPYGNVEDPRACNTTHDGHPLMVLHEGRRFTDSVALNDARINQVGGTVAPTGSFDACVTPEGVHDMVGNLLEWTRGDRPLLMGGYYLDAHINGEGCAYVTMRHGEKYHDFTTGFRCCSTPAPEDPQTTPASVTVTRNEQGFRSFDDPAAPLPPMPKPPAYASEEAACPDGMLLVDGLRCSVPEQQCLRWVDPPGKPHRACGEFSTPVQCKGGRRAMRYCIDEQEYTPEGWDLPLVHVSWTEAQRVCGAMDKRLCYEDEWEFACEGPEASPYPYGAVRDGAKCNHDKDDLFTPRGKLIDRRVAADALPECKSPFGVLNMVGNVDEWTTRAGNERPWRSILRGGWWLTGRNRCRAATESHNEIYAGPQTGFRCCKGARKRP